MGFMRAARLHKIGEPLILERIQIPNIGPDEVLIEVRTSGICGSDLHYRGGLSPVGKLPITLGHEVAGIVVKVGSMVKNVNVGDKVCLHYLVSCGKCSYCRRGLENLCRESIMIGKHLDGGFAEYIKAPSANLVKLPDNVPFEHAAIMGCAVSTAFHALRRSGIQEGEAVLVYGVGGVGAHAIQLASRIFGAQPIIAVDVNRNRFEIAEKFGADVTVDVSTDDLAQRVHEVTNGQMVDVVIDTVGKRETVEKSIACLGFGGRLVVIGISNEVAPIPIYRSLIGKELSVMGSNDHLWHELNQLVKLASSGRLNLSNSITHKPPLKMSTLEWRYWKRRSEILLRLF